MNTVTQKQVVTYLLHNVAMVLLAHTPNADNLTTAANRHRKQLFARLKPEEAEPIIKLKDAVVEFANKMASCQNSDELNACYNYLKDLNEGRVYIMADVENPADYGLQPNV